MSTPTRQARVRAPELRGAGGWIGTDGALSLRGLRGRFVLLDFWTFCCVNCLHVLDELRPLEERFADVLVVIGVHSPKFAHEADHEALRAAVERYEVHHPVLDDPELATWSQYAVRAWPTLVLVDPEGYVVHTASGEGHGEGLARLLEERVAEHEERGTLRRGGPPYVPPPPAGTALRFPGKVLALPDGRLVVTDTAHHAVVVLDADGETELQRIGDGERGLRDGTAPRFAEPQGLCLLPGGLLPGGLLPGGLLPGGLLPGGLLLVADTANHVLRTVDLERGDARTVAGTGRSWRPGDPTAGAARAVPLSTPWDVCWWEGRLVVAMAGTHQLWAYDPERERVEVLAGTTGEGLRDGDARTAYLAQPSGLAPGADRLWFVDAETSALRWYRAGGTGPSGTGPGETGTGGTGTGEIGTAVGTGLFDFGHRDGPADRALLQHPLGACVLPDGSVAVLDTYNGAVRRYDPASRSVSTLATGVAEPSGAVVVAGELVVVASAAHRLVRVPLHDMPLHDMPLHDVPVVREARRTQRPASDLAPGRAVVEVVFEPPPGQHLDERDGPATRLVVSASPPELLVDGGGAGTGLRREVQLRAGDGVLHLSASAASCDAEGEHPACHVSRQDWGVPVHVRSDGPRELRLVLRGVQDGLVVEG
ncbi:MAG: redoxin domain-containing protein [Actinomycetota bacterium]|nr:redoxin domain-containing protein [Actinomycetota bacterium]